MDNFSFHIGEGRCRLCLTLYDTGSGMQGLLTGGEKPHVGGVALAVPRPSLTGKGWSSDLYLTPVPNHKDIDLAGPLADQLARIVRQPVTITAGVHSNALTHEELRMINENFKSLIERIIATLKDSEV
jgi:gallate decarboxylase subunit D